MSLQSLTWRLRSKLKETSQALRMFHKILAWYERVSGPNDMDVAKTYNKKDVCNFCMSSLASCVVSIAVQHRLCA